ncbi:hypothetical protein HA466_0204900 [Hirschfeldia incana]|nr:hypothetical protein HA466_0204900 [Hirschfeldia incana]
MTRVKNNQQGKEALNMSPPSSLQGQRVAKKRQPSTALTASRSNATGDFTVHTVFHRSHLRSASLLPHLRLQTSPPKPNKAFQPPDSTGNSATTTEKTHCQQLYWKFWISSATTMSRASKSIHRLKPRSHPNPSFYPMRKSLPSKSTPSRMILHRRSQQSPESKPATPRQEDHRVPESISRQEEEELRGTTTTLFLSQSILREKGERVYHSPFFCLYFTTLIII